MITRHIHYTRPQIAVTTNTPTHTDTHTLVVTAVTGVQQLTSAAVTERAAYQDTHILSESVPYVNFKHVVQENRC